MSGRLPNGSLTRRPRTVQLEFAHFSWHAAKRYVERVNPEMRPKEVKKKIFTGKVRKQVAVISNGIIPLSDCYLIVKNRTVVTVHPKYKMNGIDKKRIFKGLRAN